MRKGLWVLVLLMGGCVDNEVDEAYLPMEKMTELVLDIYMAEARLGEKEIDDDPKEIWPHYNEVLLERHGITDSAYNANMTYYLSHPEFLHDVYARVVDSLLLYQQKFSEEGTQPR